MNYMKAPANDDFYFNPRSRNAPIKSSFKQVDGLPEKLKIFRIAGSKYWQVRVFNQGRYISRSLKTTDLAEAQAAAKNFYQGLCLPLLPVEPKATATNLANRHHVWHDLIEEVLQTEMTRVVRDEIKKESWVMGKLRLEGLIFDFFKIKPFDVVNTRTVGGAFTVTEYKAILQKARQLTHVRYADWGKGKRIWIPENYHTMPTEMLALIRFMVYTFVRPGDIRQLQHKHIEVVRGTYNYLRLTLPEVKRHRAPMVSLAPAVHIYERLLTAQKANGWGRPDDYVFFPEELNRRRMLDVAGWLFNWILKDLGIKRGPHGVMRSLYSLRHTAITFRLIFGGNIDLLTLARNARTSVEMIEKFYASTLSAEMNIGLLHGKRRK
jgi:integrase